jgi:2-isopropylmalate synthase
MNYNLLSPGQLARLTETSIFVDEMANLTPNIRLPYVGKAAFTHKAGTHADAVRKTRKSFEHLDPQLVGNTRDFIISDMAGSGSILEKISSIQPDLNKKSAPVRKLLEKIKKLESQGYQFEAADATFELIATRELGLHKETFQLKGFRVIEERDEQGNVHSEATIKVQKGDDFEHTAAEGDGPVNALDNALRKALIKFYPYLSTVRLDDFKVRVLDGSEGTAAKVRVLIESNDMHDHWSTIGVSTNIIEASWLALVDSMQYKLMKEEDE